MVKVPLEQGVDLNAVDHEGWTSVHVAGLWNHFDVIKEPAAFGAGMLDYTSAPLLTQMKVEYRQ